MKEDLYFRKFRKSNQINISMALDTEH
jgi:hypothetical protein